MQASQKRYLAWLLLIFAPLGAAQPAQPTLYCAYNCSSVDDWWLPPGHCTSPYCPPRSTDGCKLIPKMPPVFQSRSQCASFAASRPRCHAGGSCYVEGNLPELPKEWHHGFTAQLRMNATMWQYGLQMPQASGTSHVAIDLEGLRSFTAMHMADPTGQPIYSAMLLIGSERRMYTFINSSGVHPFKHCQYVDLKESTVNTMIGSNALDNMTFYRDADLDGEQVRIFRMRGQPPVRAESTPTRRGNLRDGPKPAPAHPAAVSVAVGGDGELYLQRPTLKPLRIESRFVLPRAEWDHYGGFQGAFSTEFFESFYPGRPDASLFKVPSWWGPCSHAPAPPQAMLGPTPMLRLLPMPSHMHSPVQAEQDLV